MSRRVYPQTLVKLMNNCSTKTVKKHGTELKELKKAVDILEYFFTSDALEIDPHLQIVTCNRYVNRKTMSDKQIRCIDLANEENMVIDVIFNTWAEVAETMRSLIIGNYYSVSRSLRWILESVLFWIYFQIIEKKDAKGYFDNYCSQSITKERFKFLSQYIPNVNRDIFDVYLHIHENNGKPTYRELVNFLNQFNIPGKLKDELNNLYHEFSGITHVSIESLEDREMVDKGYPYSMAYSYNSEKFRQAIENIWNVLDVITVILLLSTSNYYGYQNPKYYIKSLKTYQNKSTPLGPYHHNALKFEKYIGKSNLTLSKSLL